MNFASFALSSRFVRTYLRPCTDTLTIAMSNCNHRLLSRNNIRSRIHHLQSHDSYRQLL
jgi:hypothetical protein